jgi:nucleoside-diphosphate-sugar epimerase
LELHREMIRFFPDADKVPIFLPTVPGDIQHSTACVTAAAKVLEFSPSYSLQDGLAELFQDWVTG